MKNKRANSRRTKPNAPTGRAVLIRADGRELRRMTLYLPTDVAKALELLCVEQERDMSDVVTDAVNLELLRNEIGDSKR